MSPLSRSYPFASTLGDGLCSSFLADSCLLPNRTSWTVFWIVYGQPEKDCFPTGTPRAAECTLCPADTFDFSQSTELSVPRERHFPSMVLRHEVNYTPHREARPSVSELNESSSSPSLSPNRSDRWASVGLLGNTPDCQALASHITSVSDFSTSDHSRPTAPLLLRRLGILIPKNHV